MNPHDSPMKENADRIQWADPEHSTTSEKKKSNPDNCVDSEESEEERQTLKRVRGNNGEITTIRMRELQDNELQIHEQEIRRNKRVLEQQPELIREIQETYQSLCEIRRAGTRWMLGPSATRSQSDPSKQHSDPLQLYWAITAQLHT